MEEHRPDAYLKLRYYDEAEASPAAPLGDYCEIFSLVDTGSGRSTLSIEIGAMAESDMPVHRGMWRRALDMIKASAESR